MNKNYFVINCKKENIYEHILSVIIYIYI